MSETVSTGGTKSFRYEKGQIPKLKENEKEEIEKAYEKYYQRKEKERKKKIILIFLVLLIVLALSIIIFLF